MKRIRVRFEKSDFEGNKYDSCTDCALSRALNRKFKTNSAAAGEIDVYVKGEYYWINSDVWHVAEFDNQKRLFDSNPEHKFYLTLTIK